MSILIAILLVIVNTFWLALVVLQLPGIWLMVLTAGLVYLWQPAMFAEETLIAAIVLAVLSEVLEFFPA